MLSFKKLTPGATVPTKAHPEDAGFDLTAYRVTYSMSATGEYIEYDTQIAVAIPAGHVGLIFSRSSVSSATDLVLNNGVGVIDENYRGAIKLRFRQLGGKRKYGEGNRVGQLVVVPLYQGPTETIDELPDTIRGERGFGSTGM